MKITLDRSSVCAGDDYSSHNIVKDYPEDVPLFDFISDLTQYVPNMKNVVWAIVSLNCPHKMLGYIETDESANAFIHIRHDVALSTLLSLNTSNLTVDCVYYYRGAINWSSEELSAVKDMRLIDEVKYFRNHVF